MTKYATTLSTRRLPGGLSAPDGKGLTAQVPLRPLTPETLRIALPTERYMPLAAWSIGSIIKAGAPLFMTAQGVIQACPRTVQVTQLVDGMTLSSIPERCQILQLTVLEPSPPTQPCLAPLSSRPDPADLKKRAAQAGLVGLGGAGFPAHQKWYGELHTLVVNGAECEPFLTADERVMRERAPAIWHAIDVLMRAYSLTKCVIVLEDNTPDALAALQRTYPEALQDRDVSFTILESRYPSGAERQLIWLALGLEIPTTARPVEYGILVHNPGTLAALADAIDGYPLTDRIVTVTGPSIISPGVFRAPIGTPINALIAAAGGLQPGNHQVRHGGPYMGWEIPEEAPGMHAMTHCLYAAPAIARTTSPCIRCGLCAEACPVQLQPQQLFAALSHGQLDHAMHEGLAHCLRCGACDQVCPSALPLTDQFQTGLTRQRALSDEAKRADRARERFNARTKRLERQAAEAETRRHTRRQQSESALERIRAARAKESI